MDDARLRQLAQLLLDEGYADDEPDALEAAARVLAAVEDEGTTATGS